MSARNRCLSLALVIAAFLACDASRALAQGRPVIAGSGGAMVVGTLKSYTPNQLVLETLDKKPATIPMSRNLQWRVEADADAANLKPGALVTVEGPLSEDGTHVKEANVHWHPGGYSFDVGPDHAGGFGGAVRVGFRGVVVNANPLVVRVSQTTNATLQARRGAQVLGTVTLAGKTVGVLPKDKKVKVDLGHAMALAGDNPLVVGVSFGDAGEYLGLGSYVVISRRSELPANTLGSLGKGARKTRGKEKKTP